MPPKKLIVFRRMEANRKKRAPKFYRFWPSWVIQKFPEAVPPIWGAKEKALAKHLTARIGGDRILEFVKWSIDNWSAVIRTRFNWANRMTPPPTPQLPFLVKFVHIFNQAKNASNDHPLQVAELVRGLNLGKRHGECRNLNVCSKKRAWLVCD